eukprot:Nk52_evm25s359 gene=Nk52_evmTU25s359
MFNFGSTTPAATPGFGGFGGASAAPATSFGSTATSAAPAATPLSFGASATSSAATPAPLTFGTASSAAPAPAFGAVASAAPAPAFGTAASAAAPLSFGASITPAAGGLSFGKTTAAPAPLSFGATSTATSSTPWGASTSGPAATPSFGGLGTASAPTSGGLFGSTSGTTAGLGGFGAASQGATAATPANYLSTKLRSIQLPPNLTYDTKISELPQEFQKQIYDFEELIHNQNLLVDELSENSYRGMNSVTSLTEELSQQTALLAYKLDTDQSSMQKMKNSVTLDLKHAEAALRTLTMLKNPNISNARTENAVFNEYISQLVLSFERRMQQYRRHIAELETHVDSLLSQTKFTPEALTNIMRNQHETFMALAARLAVFHEEVEVEKENYLKFLRSSFDETDDPFLQKRKNEELLLKKQKLHHMNHKLSMTNNVATGGLGSLGTPAPPTTQQQTPATSTFGGTVGTPAAPQTSLFQTPNTNLQGFGTPAASTGLTSATNFSFNSAARPQLSTTKKGKSGRK